MAMKRGKLSDLFPHLAPPQRQTQRQTPRQRQHPLPERDFMRERNPFEGESQNSRPISQSMLPSRLVEISETRLQFVYQPLNSAKDEIRLVRLRDDPDEALSFDIHHFPIRHAPSYRALSYAWGEDSGEHDVLFSNCWGKVNLTLRNFLLHLREVPEDAHAYYWIDAICIDQGNIAERNQQVLRMKEIYETAAQIVIWLGSPHFFKPLLIGGLRNVKSVLCAEAMDKPETDIVNHCREMDRPELEILVSIFQCAWWQRAWIIQEASTPVTQDTSQPHTVWFGTHRYHLDACLRASDIFHKLAATGDTRYANLVPALVDDLAWIRSHRSNAESRLEILDLLPRVRRHEASDLRDKIYSILAIACDYDARDLRPDYSKPASEIYTSLVRYLIERDRNLDILAYCTEGRKIDGLPSWVPDWSRKDVSMPFPRGSFHACGDIPWSISFQNWGSSIRCKGVVVTQVHVAGLVRDQTVKPSRGWSDLSQNWFAFGMISLSHDNYNSTYEARLGALRHVLCADVTDWDGSARRGSAVRWPPEDSRHRFQFTDLDFVKDSDMNKATNLRRLLLLDNDLLGIGPAETAHGDFVCVLGGLQVPLVLRKVQEHFVIVGECYVHGIMDAEKPWQESDIRDIDIW